MAQKTWLIPDKDWGGSLAEILDSDPPRQGQAGAKQPEDETPQKNPALAFSLSLLLWGSGQMYLRQYRRGALHLAVMLGFYAALTSLLLHWSQLRRFWDTTGLPLIQLLLGLAIFLIVGLCVWLANAIHAYNASLRGRTKAFRGVGRPVWSLVCSAVLPGWGQYLNGRARKGVCLLPVGGVILLAVALLLVWPSVWPLLETRGDRVLFELLLASGLLALPLCFLLWLVSMYDAVRCCRRPRRAVAPYPHTVMRKQSPLGGLLRVSTVVLTLLLAISVAVLTIPPHYYEDAIQIHRREMLNNGMQIVPSLVGKALDLVRQVAAHWKGQVPWSPFGTL